MPAPQDLTPFTENAGMPTPVREPFPKTLLTSVNTKSETLKAFSAFPQSRFHSHPFAAATSLSGPYFEAVSLQTSSTLPGLRSTGAQGALCPQKALGPTASLAGGAPGPAPAPLPRGPQPPLRSRPPPPRQPLPQGAARRTSPRSSSPTGLLCPAPPRPPAALTPVSERWGGAWESPS